MSESPPAGVSGNTVGRHQEALTPQAIEAVLADFRAWLQEAASSSGAPGLDQEAGLAGEEGPIDLHTLLGQFLALKHEVNLQTKAVRSQQEQNAETLRLLSQSLQALRQAQSSTEALPQTNNEEQLRPLVKALVDLYDALAPAEREAARVSKTVLPELDSLVPGPEPEKELPPRSWWRRLFSRRDIPAQGPAREEGRDNMRQAVERVQQVLGSLLTGYTMSVQRVERALQQQGLEPIRSVGQPFDPERMEVVDVVANSGRAPGEVIEEVRRGYLWRGRVFRYAQVRVARP